MADISRKTSPHTDLSNAAHQVDILRPVRDRQTRETIAIQKKRDVMSTLAAGISVTNVVLGG